MQPASLWPAVLGEIELSVTHANFATWFKNSQLLHCDNDLVIIGVHNIFARQQLSARYEELIRKILLKNGFEPKRIEYKVKTSAKKASEEPVILGDDKQKPVATAAPAPALAKPAANSLAHTYRQGLNERHTFENFVVGSSNELAYAACQAVAAQPGTKYNPLFLYGGVGIGKTHLMQAVGNTVLMHKADARVVYVSSEQFVQEFVDALRFKKISDFANFYRGADVLIVDDIQFLAGKEKIQEEFFHTFNALHQANSQIILSSDKPPREIPTLEDRLRSRFVWGMSIDMQVPDFETRCAIVQNKAESHSTTLASDVVEYLANRFQENIRELEGALNQLLAWCEMRSQEPNLAVATGILGSAQARPKHISAKQIIERTARHFQVTIDDIMSSKRDKDIVVPRQVAMYMLRSELHLSFPIIARELGRKDHTTAMHSVEKISKEMQLDADIRSAVSEIKDYLYA